MSPEFYTIIGAAIALATLILNGQRSLARALADLRRDVDGLGRDVAALREQMHRNKTELLELIQRNKAELLEQMHRDKVELLGQMYWINVTLGERVARVEVLVGGPLEASASSGKGG